jgi:hypothetical protein
MQQWQWNEAGLDNKVKRMIVLPSIGKTTRCRNLNLAVLHATEGPAATPGKSSTNPLGGSYSSISRLPKWTEQWGRSNGMLYVGRSKPFTNCSILTAKRGSSTTYRRHPHKSHRRFPAFESLPPMAFYGAEDLTTSQARDRIHHR